MSCLHCPNDNDRDYPVCESCETNLHFKFRPDCKCKDCYSVIDYRALRARKSYLGLKNEDLIEEANCSASTVSAFLAGEESLKMETIIRLSAALGLKPRVIFEPIEQEKAPRLKAVA